MGSWGLTADRNRDGDDRQATDIGDGRRATAIRPYVAPPAADRRAVAPFFVESDPHFGLSGFLEVDGHDGQHQERHLFSARRRYQRPGFGRAGPQLALSKPGAAAALDISINSFERHVQPDLGWCAAGSFGSSRSRSLSALRGARVCEDRAMGVAP